MGILKTANQRPVLHFSPKQNWINDPNGLVYLDGEYHLFYQYHPYSSVWGPMHWGHAVSKDLTTWEELDIALYPDDNGTIFSGSAVVDWNNTSGFFPEQPGIVAIYTSHLGGSETSPTVQSQSLAYSQDNGRTWIKYEGNPVLTYPSNPDFRDPKVFWSEPYAKWIMALATGQTISLYSSPNLIDWTFESEFGDGAGSHEGVWECPDLFELAVQGTEERKWVLLVSVGDNAELEHGSRTQYFVGSFDGSVFTPEHSDIRWLDYGKDNYAGVSFSDIPEEDGRRIYVAWMNNWRYANQIPSSGWRGSMTIPRALSLRTSEGHALLHQHPVKELDLQFTESVALPDLLLSAGKEFEFKAEADCADLTIHLERLEGKEFGIIIHHTGTDRTVISYSADERTLSLRREQSGDTGFSTMFPLPQTTEELGQLKDIRVLIDASSVEIFANDGLASITSLIFPEKPLERLSFYSVGGKVQLRGGSVKLIQ
ncbi:glycoside hydrolase family 32 protein [Paenibacillus sp. URB8-2]|uniref:glycoside hydrolase family 32 protein n=1 Tax=Paenibacillus sp. URB8-2 TaxID=2741301 RepID=UPI0015B95494|nr:glycoside hydrolase family 32 protein [Paenibacillus sp. URB8-2]BCG57003.1 hypothetical protein PUR_04280 [Paenibacillus sp. URB8-2]